MSAHTPGPWRAELVGSPMIFAPTPKGARGGPETRIADVRGWGSLQYMGEEVAARMQDANARLIAAAPDMLTALKRVAVDLRCANMADVDTVLAAVHRVESAIAKAEGRA